MSTRLIIAFLVGVAFSLTVAGSRCSEKRGSADAASSDRAKTGAAAGGAETGTKGTDSKGAARNVDDGSSPATRGLASIDDRMIQGNAEFAFRLFRNACGAENPENIFISPFSVSVALSMTLNGASGKTEEEMAEVLGFSGMTRGEINRSMADLAATLENADSAVQLTIANSLWCRKGFSFKSEFLKTNTEFFGAETSSLDFADPGAPGVINGWVKAATRGLIAQIVDRISRETVLYLINAIYFKGGWQVEFDPSVTFDGKFRLGGGGEKQVRMMNRSGSFRYGEDDALQVLRLPYGGGRMAMYVFLPRSADGLAKFLGGLDDQAVGQWVGRLGKREGDVTIPRFKIAYECALAPALKAMGMNDAFTAGAADFSKMADGELSISDVKHKAVVEVDEKGTEAAAVTSVEMKATSVEAPRDRFSFVADRPFFFVIRDDATGALLFMGALYDPAS
jgi:serine protease inhibitor